MVCVTRAIHKSVVRPRRVDPPGTRWVVRLVQQARALHGANTLHYVRRSQPSNLVCTSYGNAGSGRCGRSRHARPWHRPCRRTPRPRYTPKWRPHSSSCERHYTSCRRNESDAPTVSVARVCVRLLMASMARG